MYKYVKLMINQENDGGTLLDDFTHLAQIKLLSRLIIRCHDKDTLCWYSTEESVGVIAKDMGVSTHYVIKLVRELVKLNILHKKSRGIYLISKRYIQVGRDYNNETK